MRKIALLFAALACTVPCQSCQNKENGTPGGEDVALQVSPEKIEFGAEGGTDSFVVTSSQKPYIVGSYDWCSARPSAFADNKTTVELTVSENKSTEERQAQFSVVCGDEKKYVDVLQAAAKGEDPVPSGDFLDTPSLPSNNAVSVTRSLGYGWNLGNRWMHRTTECRERHSGEMQNVLRQLWMESRPKASPLSVSL